MLLGIQTNQAYQDVDYKLIKPEDDQPAIFQSALLYSIHGCQHNEAEIAHLKGLGVTHFVMRLGDSIYEPDDKHSTKWRRDAVGYAEDCLRVIARFVKAGVYDYVVDNEPNIIWTIMGYVPHDNRTEEEIALDEDKGYDTWLRTFIEYIRARKVGDGYDLPKGVRLGFPPIAFTDEYPHMPWLGALVRVAAHFDFLTVHTYWQSSRQGRTVILQGPLRDRRFGANYEWYQEWQRGMPILITEWANSIHEQKNNGVPVWTPAQVEAFRLEQYPIWIEFAQAAGVEVCTVFLGPGATEKDWGGYKVRAQLAAAMAGAVASSAALTGQSRVMGGGRQAI